jgi:hypothetical protein
MKGGAMSVQTTPAQADRTLTLALNRISELFDAPAINPYSSNPVDLRGESGVVYLHKRVRQHWLRPYPIARLTIELPLPVLPAGSPAAMELTQTTQVALHRYCYEQVAQNEWTQRCESSVLWRQLQIVLPVSLLAIGLLLAIISGLLTPDRPYLQGLLFIVTLFIASIALWDVVQGLFFGWIPYAIDNHAYRVLGNLEVRIEAGSGEK